MKPIEAHKQHSLLDTIFDHTYNWASRNASINKSRQPTTCQPASPADVYWVWARLGDFRIDMFLKVQNQTEYNIASKNDIAYLVC